MPVSPNKLPQFWQELKRRKVTRVITVYAAAAFVIIDLVGNVAPSFGLPDWTLNFIVVLLCVGFIIAIILSWIYDIHPDEGIVKTKPIHKLKPGEEHIGSKGWRIASYISFVVIIGLILFHILSTSNKSKVISSIDKSIAVLPFINDSPDQERMYFINGIMESILNNLSMIEDLRVPGRTSIEQYRDNPKSIPEVAEELNVDYVLEGSGHRDGNNVRLFVQLLDGRKDQHLWSKTYDTDIEEIFAMQSEIAQLVASEIEAIITPDEKTLIEKVPTISLSAYDLYQKGREELENGNIIEAKTLLMEALNYDSTFARAYVELALVYWSSQDKSEYFSKNYLDSVLILSNIALSYNEDLSEAYALRAKYHYQTGKPNLAMKDLDKAIKLNPNNGEAYMLRGTMYDHMDLIKSIYNKHKAIGIDRGPNLANRLNSLGGSYSNAGFIEKAIYYYQESLKLSRDSIAYYNHMGLIEVYLANYGKSIEYFQKSVDLGSNDHPYLARCLYLSGYLQEALEIFEDWIKILREMGDLSFEDTHRIAYAYWINGYREEADYFMHLQIEYCLKEIQGNRPMAQKYISYYDLAAVYSFIGEKEKAYENLRIYNQKKEIPFRLLYFIKNDELFDSIREEPEFQQIVSDMEAKYQAEHERVRQWLEENDML